MFTLFSNLYRLWSFVKPQKRKYFTFLVIAMVVSAALEVIAIGTIAPFLSALSNRDAFLSSETGLLLQRIISAHITTDPLVFLIVFFGLISLISGLIRVGVLWLSIRLSFDIGADISADVYRNALHEPYAVHAQNNSSELLSAISINVERVIYYVINPVLVILTSTLTFIAIFFTILILEPLLTLILVCGVLLIYLIIIFASMARVRSYSNYIPQKTSERLKLLQEGLGGIRDIILSGSQMYFSKIYENTDRPLRRAQSNLQFLGASPRYVLEAVGLFLLAVLAYTSNKANLSLSDLVPALGLLALGIQRLLPIVQQFYNAWISLKGNQSTLRDILSRLEAIKLSTDLASPVQFNRSISLKNVSFQYNETRRHVLCQLNLDIQKGCKVGFIGETGSGKSTLLDILMGLLSPTEGAVWVDDYPLTDNMSSNWRKCIAHVPQNIHLSDCSVIENIAFGVHPDDIDCERVRTAARWAQIDEVIESWPQGYDTRVGERGIQLSGGQRQRVGLARAFYRKSHLLVLDEATSALDELTETAVMDAIAEFDPDLTVLIIAHRIHTLRHCDRIVELSAGFVKWVGTYEQLVARGSQPIVS